MDIENLQQWIGENKSINDIAKMTGKGLSTIRYWMKKYNLKSHFLNFRDAKGKGESVRGKRAGKIIDIFAFPWAQIQQFYDEGNTWGQTLINFKGIGINEYILVLAVKNNLFKTNKKGNGRKGHPQSQDAKQKIREARIKYLANHPETSSWRNVQGKESGVEKAAKDFLRNHNINFTEEFQPLLHKKRYFCIDIVFLDKKIGWEINGGQHYDTNGNLKPYYQERHSLIEAEGWKLIEIPYYEVFNQSKLEEHLNNLMNST